MQNWTAVQDPLGVIYFGNSSGILEFDGQYRMEKRPFMGLPAPDPDELMYLHPDGSLWLPGKGLFRVDSRAPKDYDQPFNVLIRKVIAKSKRILFEGTHGRFGSAFGQQRTLFESSQDPLEAPELPFRENALSFEFASVFYEKPGTTQFQYLLEGFDKEWSEWSLDTRKEYTNLPEGKYRFRVRAKNIYGTMGREAVYSLRILPPWYRTWWAYILWIIGAGTTIRKTCSIGYTIFPFYKEQPGLLTFDQSIMVADLGLFHAKNHGRNQSIYMKAGPRLPSGEDIIQKTVTSLEFALQEGYLKIEESTK